MWDEEGNYKLEYKNGMDDHPDAYLLWQTDWDDSWVRKLFWSAEEAAALSFGRSPDKICWDEDFGFRGLYGISEFATHFCNVLDAILEAQMKDILPDQIPALMYARWAEANGVPFPGELAQSVDSFYKMLADAAVQSAELEKLIHERREELERLRNELPDDLSPKLRNNLYKVVLGVAKDKYQYNIPGVAKRISNALLEHKIKVGEETILDYLRKAEDLL